MFYLYPILPNSFHIPKLYRCYKYVERLVLTNNLVGNVLGLNLKPFLSIQERINCRMTFLAFYLDPLFTANNLRFCIILSHHPEFVTRVLVTVYGISVGLNGMAFLRKPFLTFAGIYLKELANQVIMVS